MTTLAERLDTAQQQQSTTGKFGSWHQDSAARCLDLVASVIEPEIAARVAGLEAALTWIVEVNACDYEYRRKAREALAREETK